MISCQISTSSLSNHDKKKCAQLIFCLSLVSGLTLDSSQKHLIANDCEVSSGILTPVGMTADGRVEMIKTRRVHTKCTNNYNVKITKGSYALVSAFAF